MWLMVFNSIAVLIGIYSVLKKEMILRLRPSDHHEYDTYRSFQSHKTRTNAVFERYWKRTHFSQRVTIKELKIVSAVEIALVLGIAYHYNMGYLSICLFMGLIVALHVFLLEERLSYIDRCIDKSLLGYFARINASLLENQDLISALNQTEKSTVTDFIKKDLHAFNASIRAGMPVQLAFEQLQSTTHHPYLKYVYLNIEQAYLKRGDVITLMGALEEEYTLIQIEQNKRKIELDQYKKITWFSLGIVSLTALRVMQTQDYIRYYYQHDVKGRPVVILLIGLTAAGIWLLLKALKTRVD